MRFVRKHVWILAFIIGSGIVVSPAFRAAQQTPPGYARPFEKREEMMYNGGVEYKRQFRDATSLLDADADVLQHSGVAQDSVARLLSTLAGLGVRVDSAVYQGYTIPPYYDSLVGKLIVHGKTRGECLMRLKRALDEFVVDGIDTTLPLFRALVREQDILDGLYDIHWLENFLASGGMDD